MSDVYIEAQGQRQEEVGNKPSDEAEAADTTRLGSQAVDLTRLGSQASTGRTFKYSMHTRPNLAHPGLMRMPRGTRPLGVRSSRHRHHHTITPSHPSTRRRVSPRRHRCIKRLTFIPCCCVWTTNAPLHLDGGAAQAAPSSSSAREGERRHRRHCSTRRRGGRICAQVLSLPLCLCLRAG